MLPEERARAGRVFAACGVLMVLAVVLGAFLLFSGGPDGDPTSTIAQGLPEPEAEETRNTAATATPSPAPGKRRCWNGTEVDGETTCPVAVEDVQFWAFGLDRAECRPGGASSHARWSYECTVRGVDVHLAAYKTIADRDERLSTYGAPQATGGGRVLAGGPRTPAGRWLRTYDDAWAGKGLLMYASVDGKDPSAYQVLVGLRQRFPDKILQGEPVVVD